LEKKMTSRRQFLKHAAGASLAVSTLSNSAASYARIIGANDRINVVVMGVGGRGAVLAQDFASANNAMVTDLCDPDLRRCNAANATLAEGGFAKARVHADFRKALESSDTDVMVIAAPDHWHTPGAIMGLQAGKHVYLEKPVSHNPAEGELLIKAQEQYGKVVQIGNQQRSAMETIELMSRIRQGELGDIYKVYTWYANNRGTIGNGKVIPTPDWLDWDLWQGPAPRRDYQDNVVHYNWHWFWNWGTGETCNNAMHELDIARWAIGADYPDKVEVSGARRHYTDDDWEMYDTIEATYQFADATVIWEGHSCNLVNKFGRGRGTLIYGTKGWAIVDRNGYEIYDLGGKLQHEVKADAASATTDTRGGGPLNTLHVSNLLGVIRGTGNDLHSPVDDGHKSTLMCHLANIAYRTGQTLYCRPETGRPINNAADNLWSREYAPGWEPAV
jgi:predicted dehydrogenase